MVYLQGTRRGFFMRHKFGMSYWNMAFALDTMAMACAYFHFQETHRDSGNERVSEISAGLLYTMLTLASAANAILLVNTLTAVVRRKLFTPDEKWGMFALERLAGRGN